MKIVGFLRGFDITHSFITLEMIDDSGIEQHLRFSRSSKGGYRKQDLTIHLGKTIDIEFEWENTRERKLLNILPHK